MYARKSLACAAVLLAGLYSAAALTTIAPMLTNATWSGNQFQFTLHGETNVAYILQSSSDLRFWTPSTTNFDSDATRTITVPATNPHAFWRVRPIPAPVFQHAILASGYVNLGGSGRIDTFNSTNLLESTNGQYDPAKATDRASVATNLRLITALSVGNVSVYGSVMTGPGAVISVGPNGVVGSKLFAENALNGGRIEPGHFRDDFRALLPPPFLPSDFGPAAFINSAIVPHPGGTNYKYAILTDGDYQMGSISIGNGEKMLINAKARLLVLGSTTVSGSGYILLGSEGRIEWYARGQVNLGGGGCINDSRLAGSFSIVGLTTATPISYAGNAPFIGTIYAPSATVSFSGTGDAIAAVVCNSFTLTGGVSIHFDESLKSAGPFF